MAVFNLKHVSSVQVITGSRTVTVSPGGKTLTIDGISADDRDAVAILADGEFLEWAPGESKEKTISLQVYQEGTLTDGTNARVMDAIRGTGLFAGDTKVDPGNVVWTTHLRVNFSRDGVSAYLQCNNVRWDGGLQTQQAGNIIPLSGRFYSITVG